MSTHFRQIWKLFYLRSIISILKYSNLFLLIKVYITFFNWLCLQTGIINLFLIKQQKSRFTVFFIRNKVCSKIFNSIKEVFIQLYQFIKISKGKYQKIMTQNKVNQKGKVQVKQNIFRDEKLSADKNILQNLNRQSVQSHKKQGSSFSQNDKKSFVSNQQKQHSQKSVSVVNNLIRKSSKIEQKPIPITPIAGQDNKNIVQLSPQRKENTLQKQPDIQIINEQQIDNTLILNGYFNTLTRPIQSKKQNIIAKKYSSKIQEHLSTNINLGIVRIQKHQEDIQNLLQEFKMSQDQIKRFERKAYLELKNSKLKFIDPFQLKKMERQKKNNLHNQSDDKILLNQIIAKSILSQQQHKKLIQKFFQSNQGTQKRKQQRFMKEIEKQRTHSEQQKIIVQQKIRKDKELRRLSIQQKLVTKRKQHVQFVEKQKISNQRYNSMKKQKFLYQELQERYRSEVLAPALQQKKLKLKELRDFHKNFDISQIKRHQIDYLQKKSQTSSKNNSRHKITSFNYNPPERAKRLTQLLEEEKFQAKIKFQQKKRVLQQNKLRQINFISDIKIKYKPKIDTKKRQEIELRLKSQDCQPTRQQLGSKEVKQLGQKYIEQSKKLSKRKVSKQKTQGNDITKVDLNKTEVTQRQMTRSYIPTNQDVYSVKLLTKVRPDISSQRKINISYSSHKKKISQSRRNQIKKLIESHGVQRQQKLKRLKIQNQRINQIYQRKQKFFRNNEDDENTRQEAIGLLLSSIQTKIGIIDICTKE